MDPSRTCAALPRIQLHWMLNGLMRSLSLVFLRSTSLGARLGPLHSRLPSRIRAAAMGEARSLTEERVAL
jgi:hypothetical protein